jgi:hypothetical protein
MDDTLIRIKAMELAINFYLPRQGVSESDITELAKTIYLFLVG